MRRATVLLLALAIGATEACSLFVSLDGLENDSGDAGVASSSDAANDVVTAIDSGSKDGSIDADADAGPFCATHPGHELCSDFDESSIVETGWTSLDLNQGGLLSRATSLSVSAPASMASKLPAPAGTGAAARVEYDILLASSPHIHAELDIWICDLTGANSDLEVFKMNEGTGQFSDGIELAFGVADGHLDDEKAGMNIALSAAVPRQQWVHLAIDVVRGAQGSLKLEMNGDTAHPLVDATNLDTTLDNDSGAASILVGTYGALTPACTTYYDNVVVDTK